MAASPARDHLSGPVAARGGTSRFAIATFLGLFASAVVVAILTTWPPGFSLIFVVLLRADLRLAAWATVVLVVAILARRHLGERLAPVIEGLGRRPWWAAGVAFVLLAVAAKVAYRAHPLAMDEYAIWFQSRVFAAGRLTGQFPPAWLDRLIPRPFQNWFLFASHTTGEVASCYWPGFALLMTPFAWLGAPWLCNPALAALSIALVGITARKLAPDRPGAPGWAIGLSIASPAFVALGISYYSMTAVMLANLVFTWGFLSERPRALFISGVVGSLALWMQNPVPHALFAIPWIAWLLRRRGLGRPSLALALGYAPLTLLLGAGWLLVRLHFRVPAAASAPSGLPGAFQALLLNIHPPTLSILGMRLAGLAKLWLWAVPGLLVLAALGWWEGRRVPFVRLLGASALLTFVGYFMVPWDQGHGWGYRYFHSAWSALPLLAAMKLGGSGPAARGEGAAGASEPAGGGHEAGPRALAAALVAASLVAIVPAQLRFIHGFISRQLEALPASPGPGERRLVIIDGRGAGFYLEDLVQNDPFLRGLEVRMIGGIRRADDAFVRTELPGAREVAGTRAARVWAIPDEGDGPSAGAP